LKPIECSGVTANDEETALAVLAPLSGDLRDPASCTQRLSPSVSACVHEHRTTLQSPSSDE
jgi:hypothetical protein